ncbi:uncharacterized protein LOC62_02G003335 [Vanrija pseudolonga]|uniref:Uncharacterized protein n=1 Tax=Vanrija pseudolonga TaxID=143232 RepID=A0AAF0Y433_9TREE|nr:hypothetical protein LOC62_02G003335 [Vanrija pseudolonga]
MKLAYLTLLVVGTVATAAPIQADSVVVRDAAPASAPDVDAVVPRDPQPAPAPAPDADAEPQAIPYIPKTKSNIRPGQPYTFWFPCVWHC